MNPNVEYVVSPELRLILQVLTMPVAWLPPVQEAIARYLWNFSYPPEAIAKLVFFLLPALSLLSGLWCSMLSLYTLPFRSGRRQLVGALVISWWDFGRSLFLFWVGILRFALLALGWIWGFLRLLVAGLYFGILELLTLPFSLVGRATRSTMEPGIPWIAVSLTLAWALLEAGLFSYTLYPTVFEIASDLVGSASHPYLQPVLFFVLFLLVTGSFACLQVMVEAIQQRNWKDIVQMVVVEVFVMFVEVVFLYRELVDAITPALAQQSGGQIRLGLTGVLLISSMGWVGVRGMTWFLFGRFGTPTLLAIISGRGILMETRDAIRPAETGSAWVRTVMERMRTDLGWFQTAGKELHEASVLPPLQMIAATINFFMVFFSGSPLFRLPLDNAHAFVQTGELLKVVRMHSGRAPAGGDRG